MLSGLCFTSLLIVRDTIIKRTRMWSCKSTFVFYLSGVVRWLGSQLLLLFGREEDGQCIFVMPDAAVLTIYATSSWSRILQDAVMWHQQLHCFFFTCGTVISAALIYHIQLSGPSSTSSKPLFVWGWRRTVLKPLSPTTHVSHFYNSARNEKKWGEKSWVWQAVKNHCDVTQCTGDKDWS